MQRKSVSGSPATSHGVQPKAGLATFYGIGTEEIRKSIDTLDRILDQYDGGAAPRDGQPEKKFTPVKIDPAAQKLASCMKLAGNHKLRKRSDDELPPPPPELLTEATVPTVTAVNTQSTVSELPVQLSSSQSGSLRVKCPPVIPKRGPDTRLSTSSSSESSIFSSQVSRDEDAESLGGGAGAAAAGCSSGSSRRYPESGYITPDQELIDSIFASCSGHHDRVGPARPPPAAAAAAGFQRGAGSDPSVLLPPAEFSDVRRSISAAPCETGSNEILFNRFRLSLPGCIPDILQSVEFDQQRGSRLQSDGIGSTSAFGTSSLSKLTAADSKSLLVSDSVLSEQILSQPILIDANPSLAPYLACIVPPPPSIVDDITGNYSTVLSDATALIVPPPPADLLPQPTVVPSHRVPTSSASISSPLPSSIGEIPASKPALDSASKLPPPRTMPKQPKKGPSMESDITENIPSASALVAQWNKSADAVVSVAQNSHKGCLSNGSVANPPAPPADFFPPPPSVFPPCSEILPLDPGDYNVVPLPPPPPPPHPHPQVLQEHRSSLPCFERRSSAEDDLHWRRGSTGVTSPPSAPVGNGNGSGLAAALQAVRLHSSSESGNGNTEERSTVPQSRTSLIDQIHAGIQLRSSVAGTKLRTVDNCAGDQQQTHSRDLMNIDGNGAVNSYHGNNTCSFMSSPESPSAPFSTGMPLGRDAQFQQQQAPGTSLSVDITRHPGYQEIPPNCPVWKRAMIEKKNKQLEEDAMRELLARKQEEDRWKDIPEWKKSLILEKEKKKQEEMVSAPYQVERQKYDNEMERLQSLPEWKRNLIIKKRTGDTS